MVREQGMRCRVLWLLLIAVCLGGMPLQAQDNVVVVPDLFGMNVPQAAAALNAAGLVIGEQLTQNWTEASGMPPESIIAQGAEAGATLAAGSAVNVIVLRTANMRVIYDDNDFTLLNLNAVPGDVARLSFTANNNPASFVATRLTGALSAGECIQIWSIPRSSPKSLDECGSIQRWVSTMNPGEHFWTAANGVETFNVVQDGVTVHTCPAAPVGSEGNVLRCDFFIGSADGSGGVTEYLYFAYTAQAIALINPSENQWMATANTLYNYNPSVSIPGVGLQFDDPNLFSDGTRRRPGSIQQLAPGQCLVMTAGTIAADASPQPCHVIAQFPVDPNLAFWLADFEVESVNLAGRRVCPAAIADRMTICVVPR